MTLADFLLARIAEDETVARDWAHQGARKVEIHGGGSGYEAIVNPARVLVECEAKRRIVEMFQDADARAVAEWPDPSAYEEQAERGSLLAVVRVVTLPYADHPDYREDWRT